MEHLHPWRDIQASLTGRKTYTNKENKKKVVKDLVKDLSQGEVEAFTFEVKLRSNEGFDKFEKVGTCTRTFAEFEQFLASLPVAIVRDFALTKRVKPAGFQLFGNESEKSIEVRRLNEMQSFLNCILLSEQLWLQDGRKVFDFICPPPRARRDSTLPFKATPLTATTRPIEPTVPTPIETTTRTNEAATGTEVPEERTDHQPTTVLVEEEEDPANLYPAAHLFHAKRRSWEAFEEVWSPLDESPKAKRFTNLWHVLLWDIGLLDFVNDSSHQILDVRGLQKKMVRSLRNYLYSQRVWNHVIRPLFLKTWPGVMLEQVRKGVSGIDWVLNMNTLCGGRVLMNASIESFLRDDMDLGEAPVPYSTVVVQDALSIRAQINVAGIYVRLLDTSLNAQQPLVQFAVENVITDIDIENRIGMTFDETSKFDLKLFVTLSGDFYNRKSEVRVCEPYLETCIFSLNLFKLKQAPEANVGGSIYHLLSPIMDADCIPQQCKHADQFININVTSQFLSNLVLVSSIFQDGEEVQGHVADVEGAAFYLANETGLSLRFSVKPGVVPEEPCFLDPPLYESTHNENDPLLNKQRRVCVLKEVGNMSLSRSALGASSKWKELRMEFEKADSNGTQDGVLDVEEVAKLLHRMIKTTATHQQPPPHRSENGVQPLCPMGGIQSTINRFMRKADRNASGKISWLEFREAVEDWRNESGCLLEVRIEGFEAFQCDYNQSGARLMRLTPSKRFIFGDFRDEEEPPIVEVVVEYWISEALGSIITIRSPLTIRNSCHKATEVLISHGHGGSPTTEPARRTAEVNFNAPKMAEREAVNPAPSSESKYTESKYTIEPNGSLFVPLQVVNSGAEMKIRQVNEEHYSTTSLKLDIPKDATQFSPWSSDLKVRSHLLKDRVDGQPLRYLRKTLHRDHDDDLMTPAEDPMTPAEDWVIEILPQIVIWSSLPVEFEYKVAQVQKADTKKRRSSLVETKKAIQDSFKHVEQMGEVNARVGNIASGECAHVFGLDMFASAYLRLSLYNGEERLELEQDVVLPLASPANMNFAKKLSFFKTTNRDDADGGSHGEQQHGRQHMMELQIQSIWTKEQPFPTVKISAPVWVLNKTGLPLDCSIWDGKKSGGSTPSFTCEERVFKSYFHKSPGQADVEELCKDIPLLLYATKSSQFAVKLADAMDSVTGENENGGVGAPASYDWNRHIGKKRVAMGGGGSSKEVKKVDTNKTAWSTRCLLSLPGSSFELVCPSGVVISLDIQALPGIYEGTVLATLFVPYTVVNTLNVPIQIYPSFEAAGVTDSLDFDLQGFVCLSHEDPSNR
jgi:hypothetical protein